MILFYILLGLMAASTTWATIAWASEFAPWHRNTRWYDYIKSFFVGAFLSLCVGGLILIFAQGLGNALAQRSTDVTYSQPLANLKDGTGIEGQFYGGLFVRRGYVQDTQVFSYYRVVAPNQYSLENRDARQSTVWTDATPETARVDITDRVYSCEPTWYLIECSPKPNEFVHANFHVPADSIEQKFELDAQ